LRVSSKYPKGIFFQETFKRLKIEYILGNNQVFMVWIFLYTTQEITLYRLHLERAIVLVLFLFADRIPK